MSNDHPVIKALGLLDVGDKAFDDGNLEQALECFQDALALADQVPPTELWDRPAFVASCKSRLSAALGGLGKTEESLQAANDALAFFDKFGSMYPLGLSEWFRARVAKGDMLFKLGRFEEAIPILKTAKAMLGNDPDADRFHKMVDQMINQNLEGMKYVKAARIKRVLVVVVVAALVIYSLYRLLAYLFR